MRKMKRYSYSALFFCFIFVSFWTTSVKGEDFFGGGADSNQSNKKTLPKGLVGDLKQFMRGAAASDNKVARKRVISEDEVWVYMKRENVHNPNLLDEYIVMRVHTGEMIAYPTGRVFHNLGK